MDKTANMRLSLICLVLGCADLAVLGTWLAPRAFGVVGSTRGSEAEPGLSEPRSDRPAARVTPGAGPAVATRAPARTPVAAPDKTAPIPAAPTLARAIAPDASSNNAAEPRPRVEARNTGDAVSLKSPVILYFETNSSSIRTLDRVLLNHLARRLRWQTMERVRILGHADRRGEQSRNHQLGLERAKSVAAWLATKGVEAKRISARSLGSTKPLDLGETPQALARNRRVEVYFDRKQRP